MANDAFEYLTNWNKTAFEAIKNITETNVKITEKLMEEQVALSKSLISDSSKMLDSISACKDAKDVLSKQSAMAEETSKQIMKSARTCADILAQASQTYTNLFEENLETASKATKDAANAASSAAKKAA